MRALIIFGQWALSVRLWIAAGLVLLAGCSSVTPPARVSAPQYNWQASYDSHGIAAQAVAPPAHIYALPESARQQFLTWYHAPSRQHIAPQRRLADYLAQTLHGYTYSGRTHTAAQAATLDTGNCLSLAVLTAAYAELAGLTIRFQMVYSEPVYKQFDNVLLVSSHVRSKVYGPAPKSQDDTMIVSQPAVIIDYFPALNDATGRFVERDWVSAMFYRNLAAGALIDKQPEQAFWLAEQALQLAPQDAENVNTMAVILSRLGKTDQAMALYAKAVAAGVQNVTLLSNYRQRLLMRGQTAAADELEQMIAQHDEQNPYVWIKLGEEHLAAGNAEKARVYFERARKQAPYLDDAYSGLARAYFLQGDVTRTAEALEQAHAYAWDEAAQQRYKAKQAALEGINQ